MQENVMSKRMTILGGGESGVGAAILADQRGYDVFVSDGAPLKEQYRHTLSTHGIEFEEGRHTASRILAADEVMKSPGIPEKNELVKEKLVCRKCPLFITTPPCTESISENVRIVQSSQCGMSSIPSMIPSLAENGHVVLVLPGPFRRPS